MKAQTIFIDDRVAVMCPECDEVIPVVITVNLNPDPYGVSSVTAEPNLNDVWDHWNMTHGPSAEG